MLPSSSSIQYISLLTAHILLPLVQQLPIAPPLYSIHLQEKERKQRRKMIASSFHLLLPFSLLLLLLHGALGGDIVNQTCKKIADGDPNVTFDFCVATLQAVPESHSASLDKLGVIAMNLTKCNATQTMAYAKKLMKQKWKTHTRNCLKDCVELYSDAISSLKVAMDDVKIESYFEANIHISATMDAPMTCEDGFKEKKGTESPLSNRNKDMFQLSAIALSIINMLSQDQV